MSAGRDELLRAALTEIAAPLVRSIRARLDAGDDAGAEAMRLGRPYPLPATLAAGIGIDPE